MTGDCDSFLDYVYGDIKKWKTFCETEKSGVVEPIKNFEIKQITHNFLSNKAFLRISLTKNIAYEDSNEDYTYFTTYEIRKDGFKWKIDLGDQ